MYNYKCQTCLGSTASGHQLLFFYFAQGQELVFPWNHIITKAGEDTRSDTEASRLELLCSNVHWHPLLYSACRSQEPLWNLPDLHVDIIPRI